MSYKPQTYNDVSPYLIVTDLETTLRFLEKAFGAERLRVDLHADGSPKHSEARIGDSVIMIGQASSACPSHVHVYVPDVRATYEAAIAAGGTSVQEPLDQNDGDLRAGVQDPSGTTWWPATQLQTT